jgi:CBS domain containing-hemolysin-like protein
VLGSVKFQDMLEYMNEKSPEEDEIPNTTVGSWVLENSGRLPRTGERIVWHNLQITVSRMQRNRVMEVTINRNKE